MNVKECSADCGRSEQTVRRWVKKRGLKAEKVGFNGELYIDPEDWESFCNDHGIQRGKG